MHHSCNASTCTCKRHVLSTNTNTYRLHIKEIPDEMEKSVFYIMYASIDFKNRHSMKTFYSNLFWKHRCFVRRLKKFHPLCKKNKRICTYSATNNYTQASTHDDCSIWYAFWLPWVMVTDHFNHYNRL